MQDNGSPISSEERHPGEGSEETGSAAAQDALGQDALGQDALGQDAELASDVRTDGADIAEAPGEGLGSGETADNAADVAETEPDHDIALSGDEAALMPGDAAVNGSTGDSVNASVNDAADEGMAAQDDERFAADAPEWPLPAPTGGAITYPERGEVMMPVPWTMRQALTGTALTLVPWLIFAIGAQLAAIGVKQPAPHKFTPAADLTNAVVVFIISAVLEGIFLIAPLIYASRATPSLQGTARLRSMLATLGLRPPRMRLAQTAAAIIGAIVVILIASYAYDAIRQALHLTLKTNADTLLEMAKYEPYTVIATLLVAVLVAPICEEIFFRGFIFPGLARGIPIWGAVVGSALLFGIAHADVGSFVVLVVIGIALAVVRWRTDSLWPGVVIHTLNNAIALVGILVLLRQ